MLAEYRCKFDEHRMRKATSAPTLFVTPWLGASGAVRPALGARFRRDRLTGTQALSIRASIRVPVDSSDSSRVATDFR
jgi:hypothetical protein